VNGELLKAVKEAVISEERSMRGIDLGSPLWGQRIAQERLQKVAALAKDLQKIADAAL